MDNLFNILKATELADATSDAYKFDSFGRDEWLKCIVFLYSKGLDPSQVEYILRSKHMRWSEDFQFTSESDSDAFINYYHANFNHVQNTESYE